MVDGGYPGELRLATAERPTETQSGLLLALVREARELRFFETLAEGLDLKMNVVTYSHQQKLATLVAGLVQGTRHIAELQSRVVPDTVAAGLVGLARFPDQSQINALLRAMGPAQVEHLERAHQRLRRAHSLAGDRARWWGLESGPRLLAGRPGPDLSGDPEWPRRRGPSAGTSGASAGSAATRKVWRCWAAASGRCSGSGSKRATPMLEAAVPAGLAALADLAAAHAAGSRRLPGARRQPVRRHRHRAPAPGGRPPLSAQRLHPAHRPGPGRPAAGDRGLAPARD